MNAAGSIMADIMSRHARKPGAKEFRRFVTGFRMAIVHQRAVPR